MSAPWRSLVRGAIAPYVTIAGGPVVQFRHHESGMRATAIARTGGGLDFRPGRGRTSIGVSVVYDWMPDFRGSGGINYTGLEVALNVGWAKGGR